jgi:FlaA1/EpsC-like NDP-sugar epimerase
MIAKELLASPDNELNPIGFIDDDSSMHRYRVCDLPVFGSLSDLSGVVRKHMIDQVVIAMPSASGAVVREVVKNASSVGVETRTVPGLFEILSGRVGISTLREVQIEDLLRRAPVEIDLDAVSSIVTDSKVLVTGAGGSIGSELCRQVASLDPRHLILLGHGENSIFEIQNELLSRFPGLQVTPVIADVRNPQRIREVVRAWRPHAIFHAAAHKHVPLMEANVVEAVTNNVLGTRNVVDAAALYGTKNFVLISTDKAVRPSSVMGATKRAAEIVVQLAAHRHGANFVSVRFGNVLGSRGSVVPTFLRQIRMGGPVTITHPEMRRYFMTIPEAVQLVLQAGALGRGGEVFVLDMGEPVRIVDLAQDLIRLSGLEVGRDIELKFTGARPGEKLYEEMFFSSEMVQPTNHPKVLRARKARFQDNAEEAIEELISSAFQHASAEELVRMMRHLIPDFQRGPALVPGIVAEERVGMSAAS